MRKKLFDRSIYFNKHTKLAYMQEVSGRLDRHKVCACYMYAIIKANIAGCRLADSETEAIRKQVGKNKSTNKKSEKKGEQGQPKI